MCADVILQASLGDEIKDGYFSMVNTRGVVTQLYCDVCLHGPLFRAADVLTVLFPAHQHGCWGR